VKRKLHTLVSSPFKNGILASKVWCSTLGVDIASAILVHAFRNAVSFARARFRPRALAPARVAIGPQKTDFENVDSSTTDTSTGAAAPGFVGKPLSVVLECQMAALQLRAKLSSESLDGTFGVAVESADF